MLTFSCMTAFTAEEYADDTIAEGAAGSTAARCLRLRSCLRLRRSRLDRQLPCTYQLAIEKNVSHTREHYDWG